MKTILLKDVAKVGQRYEVKELADGYARNFIIARGLGMMADVKNLKKLEELKKRVSIEPQLAELTNIKIHLKVKTNSAGHLFAGIHPDDIVRQLRVEQGINFPSESILLKGAIKSVGEHPVKIKIADQVGQFLLIVETA